MSKHLATRCVHAGDSTDPLGSPHTPIYTTTTFKFPSTAALLDMVEARSRRGISDAMLRLSVGLEDAGDLIADLEQALGRSHV